MPRMHAEAFADAPSRAPYSKKLRGAPFRGPPSFLDWAYTTLGVPRPSTTKAIRRAYLRNAICHHPDKKRVHPSVASDDAFIRIKEAYRTLMDHPAAAQERNDADRDADVAATIDAAEAGLEKELAALEKARADREARQREAKSDSFDERVKRRRPLLDLTREQIYVQFARKKPEAVKVGQEFFRCQADGRWIGEDRRLEIKCDIRLGGWVLRQRGNVLLHILRGSPYPFNTAVAGKCKWATWELYNPLTRRSTYMPRMKSRAVGAKELREREEAEKEKAELAEAEANKKALEEARRKRIEEMRRERAEEQQAAKQRNLQMEREHERLEQLKKEAEERRRLEFEDAEWKELLRQQALARAAHMEELKENLDARLDQRLEAMFAAARERKAMREKYAAKELAATAHRRRKQAPVPRGESAGTQSRPGTQAAAPAESPTRRDADFSSDGAQLTVAQLKERLRRHEVDLSGCIEKSDLVRLYAALQASAMSVAQLKEQLRRREVDFGGCIEKSDLVQLYLARKETAIPAAGPAAANASATARAAASAGTPAAAPTAAPAVAPAVAPTAAPDDGPPTVGGRLSCSAAAPMVKREIRAVEPCSAVPVPTTADAARNVVCKQEGVLVRACLTAQPVLRVGVKVKAKLLASNGRNPARCGWHPGTITVVHRPDPGRWPEFDVEYDDGATENGVRWKFVRLAAGGIKSHFEVGLQLSRLGERAQHSEPSRVVRPNEAIAEAGASDEVMVTADSTLKRRSRRHHRECKHEDLLAGIKRCPSCGNEIVVSERGCRVVTCRSDKHADFFHFCFYCNLECIGGDGPPHCKCPYDKDIQTRRRVLERKKEERRQQSVAQLGADDSGAVDMIDLCDSDA